MEIRRRKPNPPVKVGGLAYQVTTADTKARHILEEIVWQKDIEIEKMRESLSLQDLQKKIATSPPTRDFLTALIQGKTNPALIAEVKKASPSKGVIREDFNPVEIAIDYQRGGASCLSVLTDEKFFQGSFANLALIRQAIDLPLLCKEFIVSPYQIYLARTQGADAILLIAAILGDRDLKYFVKIINSLGMIPLIEVHTLSELDRVLNIEGVTLVGINNRNLENFSVDLQTTSEILAARGEVLRQRSIKVVSESGLHTSSDVSLVKQAGADAVLIGESLVKQTDIVQAINSLFSA